MSADTAETVAEVLPLRPADAKSGLGAKTQYAPPRPHAHEAEPAPERRSFTLRMPSMRIMTGLLSGGSLLATAAPAVLAVWASHVVAANYFRHWYFKYPRLAYGFGHAFIEAPIAYLWVWSGHSPVLRLTVVGSVLIILRALGVHVIWSWL